MALPCLAGGCSLLLLLFTITRSGRGEVLLIHESGKGTAWGYSHLPSTFPLTWSQARSACEAIPGSMLARVDGWQAEAAVEEYLREAAFAEPVWLANRQTLPEVIINEVYQASLGGTPYFIDYYPECCRAPPPLHPSCKRPA